ncbi:hypothetical protein ABZW18_26175 [Streptomyces sp. NPDC004647]|uniref:DUF5983 family protein n=1 Tax=Streptomyces sp. NPDC004647 TaxID=3154671 RepID=UPI0033A2317F
MGFTYDVDGKWTISPAIPLAVLRERLDANLPFHVAPLDADESQLAELVDREGWLLVPAADATVDAQENPTVIDTLLVSVDTKALTIDTRLDHFAKACAGYELDGELDYQGADGGEGLIKPCRGARVAYEWTKTGPADLERGHPVTTARLDHLTTAGTGRVFPLPHPKRATILPACRDETTPDLTIRSFLDLSTAHLRKESRADLNSYEGVVAYKTTYGWLVYASEDADLAEGDDWPSELLPLVKLARANGCEYILFDADAPETDALPTFDEK